MTPANKLRTALHWPPVQRILSVNHLPKSRPIVSHDVLWSQFNKLWRSPAAVTWLPRVNIAQYHPEARSKLACSEKDANEDNTATSAGSTILDIEAGKDQDDGMISRI